MDAVLFLILVIVLGAALPWPNSAYGRSRHHRPYLIIEHGLA